MEQYINLGNKIRAEGIATPDRTGNGRIRIFGTRMEFNLKEGFPLLTTKKVFTKGIVHELIDLFLTGGRDNRILTDKGVNIWNQWAVKEENIDSFLILLQGAHETAGNQPMTAAHIAELRASLSEHAHSIGNMYGTAWRAAPTSGFPSPLQTGRQVYDRMLSDQQEYVRDILAQHAKTIDTASESELQNVVGALTQNGVDQLAYVMHLLKNDPYSARICVSAWIPEWLPYDGVSPEHNVLLGKGCLAACHTFFQFFAHPMTTRERQLWLIEKDPVARKAAWDKLMEADIDKNDGDAMAALEKRITEVLDEANVPKNKLSCQLYQRSADFCIGVPFNIASYALLTHMIAQCVNMDVDKFIWVGGDTHFYSSHPETWDKQAQEPQLPLCKLELTPGITDILKFTVDDVKFVDYQHGPVYKYDLAK